MKAQKTRAPTIDEVKAELERVARIGQMFIEGDACRKVWTPEAQTFMAGDDMNYDAEVALPLKKTLLRVERLCAFPCSTTLWRQRPDIPSSGEALLFGSFGAPSAGGKPGNRGYKPPAMTPELKAVFLRGKDNWRTNGKASACRTLASRDLVVQARGAKALTMLRLLVPVKDSMGEIAAALEVFTVVSPPRRS